MDKPIKSIMLAVVIVAAAGSAAYTLNLLDQIVHGTLYNYGLLFDLAWANPYWNLLHIIQVLLGIVVAATIVNVIFTVRNYLSMKKPIVKITPSQKPAPTSQLPTRPIFSKARRIPSTTHTIEKPSTTSDEPSPASLRHESSAPLVPPATTHIPPPAPAPAPGPAQLSSEIRGLIRCSHCGKTFTQPLRMLDFQGDRPRIVNICPFCNEIMTATQPAS